MPNMMVTEVFKFISQGLFGSCMMRTVSLGADNERGELSLANGAIDALCSRDQGQVTGLRGIVCVYICSPGGYSRNWDLRSEREGENGCVVNSM